jgi:hypothetical protein
MEYPMKLAISVLLQIVLQELDIVRGQRAAALNNGNPASNKECGGMVSGT